MIAKFVAINKRVCIEFASNNQWFIPKGDFRGRLLEIVDERLSEFETVRVLEVGGIDRPLINKSPSITYDGLDIEYNAACDLVYDNFYCQSIELPVENAKKKYNLITSITLLEHVPNNKATITNCYELLDENGVMAHYVPSKWHPYSIILRAVGSRWQKKIILVLRPEAISVTGYPTYFNYCSPSSMFKLLKSEGFKEIKIIPFFSAADYFNFFFPFFLIVLAWENFCRLLKLEWCCSGFIFTAIKGAE